MGDLYRVLERLYPPVLIYRDTVAYANPPREGAATKRSSFSVTKVFYDQACHTKGARAVGSFRIFRTDAGETMSGQVFTTDPLLQIEVDHVLEQALSNPLTRSQSQRFPPKRLIERLVSISRPPLTHTLFQKLIADPVDRPTTAPKLSSVSFILSLASASNTRSSISQWLKDDLGPDLWNCLLGTAPNAFDIHRARRITDAVLLEGENKFRAAWVLAEKLHSIYSALFVPRARSELLLRILSLPSPELAQFCELAETERGLCSLYNGSHPLRQFIPVFGPAECAQLKRCLTNNPQGGGDDDDDDDDEDAAPGQNGREEIATIFLAEAEADTIREGHAWVLYKPAQAEMVAWLVEQRRLFQPVRSGRVYLPWVEQAHLHVVGLLQRLFLTTTSSLIPDADWSDVTESGTPLNIVQERAARMMFDGSLHRGGFCYLTGGPGTGKTQVLRTIVRAAASISLKIVIVSPTATAAAHAERISGHRGQTIDLALGQTVAYWANVAIVVIEEASMLSLSKLAELCKKLQRHAPDLVHMFFSGDKNQLPSPEPGLPFVGVMRAFPTRGFTLSHCYRCDPGILALSDSLFSYQPLQQWQLRPLNMNYGMVGVPDGVHVISVAQAQDWGPLLLRLWNLVLSPKDRDTCRILTHRNVDVDRVHTIVGMPADDRTGERSFSAGDSICFGKNHYPLSNSRNVPLDCKVTNGQVATIMEIIDYVPPNTSPSFPRNNTTAPMARKGARRAVRISDNDWVDWANTSPSLTKYSLCTTVHRSQGQEFDLVILVLPRAVPRDIVGTAVSRARNKCIIITSAPALLGVSNSRMSIDTRRDDTPARLTAGFGPRALSQLAILQ